MDNGNSLMSESMRKELPEFGRAACVEFHFGIKRGLLYKWLSQGKIRSISLRDPGKKFGVRLFFLPGIRAMLLKMLVEQNGESRSEQDGGNPYRGSLQPAIELEVRSWTSPT